MLHLLDTEMIVTSVSRPGESVLPDMITQHSFFCTTYAFTDKLHYDAALLCTKPSTDCMTRDRTFYSLQGRCMIPVVLD